MRTSQAASAVAAGASTAGSSIRQPPAHEAASDAETEPLPYSDDEDAEGEVDEDEEAQGTSSSLPSSHRNTRTPKHRITPRSKSTMADSSGADSLDDAAATLAGLGDLASAAIPGSEASPSKTAGSDGLSDESELSDAPDEGDGEEDGGSEDGEGSSEEVDDEQEEEEEEENDGESSDALGEDEEEDEEEEEDEDEGGDDEDEGQTGKPAVTPASRGRRSRQERENIALADTAEQEEDEDAASSLAALAGGATNVDAAPQTEEDEEAEADESPDKAIAARNSRSSLKNRKRSLLGPQILLDPTSNDSEPATSRQPSVDAEGADEEDEDEDADDEGEEMKGDADEEMVEAPVDAEGPPSGAASKDASTPSGEAAAGTPVPEAPEPEDEAATDEAALRRTEALDALTKIELGFAMLRDRLYTERIEEVSKEGEMVLDGTHPELIHLTALIEARRQHRLRMVEIWFEEEQRHFAKMAATEERLAWQSWKHDVAELRRDSMDELSCKRRKLEREKRNIDAPRPARRHQVFETELIGDPDLAHAAAQAAKADREPGIEGRRRATREAQELAMLGSHIALPDLRGLEDYEAWSDLERMGILRPDLRMAPLGTGTHARGTPVPQPQSASAHLPPQSQTALPHHHRHSIPHHHQQHLDSRHQAEMAGYYVGPMDGPSSQHSAWGSEAALGYGAPLHPSGRPMTIAELNMYQDELYAEQQYHHQQQQQAAYAGHPHSHSHPHPHAGYPRPPSPQEYAQQQHYEREREHGREMEREREKDRAREKERDRERDREKERERGREKERMNGLPYHHQNAQHSQSKHPGDRYVQSPPSPPRYSQKVNHGGLYSEDQDPRHHYPQAPPSLHPTQSLSSSSGRPRDDREQRDHREKERETKPFANGRGNRHNDGRDSSYHQQQLHSSSSGHLEQHDYPRRPIPHPESPRRTVQSLLPQSPPPPQLPSPRGSLAPLPHRQHQAPSPSSYQQHRSSHSQHQFNQPSASPQMDHRRHSDGQDSGRGALLTPLPPAQNGTGMPNHRDSRSPLPPPAAGIVAAAYGGSGLPSESPSMIKRLPSPTRTPLGLKPFDNSPESRLGNDGRHGGVVDAEMRVVASGQQFDPETAAMQSTFAHRLPLSTEVKGEVGVGHMDQGHGGRQ